MSPPLLSPCQYLLPACIGGLITVSYIDFIYANELTLPVIINEVLT